jgi:hypothetical protein
MSRIHTTSKKNFFASFFKKVNPFQTEKRKDKIKAEADKAKETDEFETGEMVKSGHGNSGKRNKRTPEYRKKRDKTNRIKRQSRRANIRRGK